MVKLIAYYRVSTRKQGDSGLGLEAQQAAVANYAREGAGNIIASYQEVESGKRKDRPQLAAAISHARSARAILVIAKLDRLARNVHFLSGLMEGAVPFVCCDMPQATALTLPIMAAVAEDEARRISDRTKAALQAYKARGGILGTPGNLKPEDARRGARNGAAATKAAAAAAYAPLIPKMRSWREAGMSNRRIARLLHESGYTTYGGGAWTPVQVQRVFARYA